MSSLTCGADCGRHGPYADGSMDPDTEFLSPLNLRGATSDGSMCWRAASDDREKQGAVRKPPSGPLNVSPPCDVADDRRLPQNARALENSVIICIPRGVGAAGNAGRSHQWVWCETQRTLLGVAHRMSARCGAAQHTQSCTQSASKCRSCVVWTDTTRPSMERLSRWRQRCAGKKRKTRRGKSTDFHRAHQSPLAEKRSA